MSSARGRVVAVDVARGAALLGSGVATATVWLYGRQVGPGFRPLDRDPVDRALDLLSALLVDNRVLAVFALLLGFGLAAAVGRAEAEDPADGVDRARVAALRRAGLLLGVGALHAALVLEADVLGTLAVVLVVGVLLVRARLRTQLVVCALVVPALVLQGAADGVGGSAGFPDPPADYLASVVDRVGTWLLVLVLVPFTQLGLVVPLVMGLRLARSGWLHRPGQHRRGLLVLGAGGTLLGLAGALPFARSVSAAGSRSAGGAELGAELAATALAGVLSSLTGPLAALGTVCLVGLAVSWRGPRRAAAPVAVLGRHSLAVYLAQSVALALLLAPWAGGGGGRWGSAAVAGLGVGSWLLALAVVVVVRRAGRTRSAPGRAQPNDEQGRPRSSAT